MNLRAAFLADQAMQNSDGTFMVWRGGITDIQTSSFPASVKLVLVLRIEADPDEVDKLHHIDLRVVYGGREQDWQRVPVALSAAAGEPFVYLNLLANIFTSIDQAGRGYIDVLIDGEIRIPKVHFAVKLIEKPPWAS